MSSSMSSTSSPGPVTSSLLPVDGHRWLESRFRDNMGTHINAAIARKKLKAYWHISPACGFNSPPHHLSALGDKLPMHEQLQHWVEWSTEAPWLLVKRRLLGRAVGYALDIDDHLEEMAASKPMHEVICRICYEMPDNPRITDVSVP
ncbi:hypothetical protein VTI74DRAFT_7234 [Chaetomium olivicolor]